MRKAQFDLEDFRKQIGMMRKMGPLQEIMSYLPFVGGKLDSLDLDEKQIDRIEAIINSMTSDERRQPRLINASRRNRIANGSGTDPREVNRLLKQFRQMKKMMQKVMRGSGDLSSITNALPKDFRGSGERLPSDFMNQMKKQSRGGKN
jgi:signal recognition particle subunit SRP54